MTNHGASAAREADVLVVEHVESELGWGWGGGQVVGFSLTGINSPVEEAWLTVKARLERRLHLSCAQVLTYKEVRGKGGYLKPVDATFMAIMTAKEALSPVPTLITASATRMKLNGFAGAGRHEERRGPWCTIGSKYVRPTLLDRESRFFRQPERADTRYKAKF